MSPIWVLAPVLYAAISSTPIVNTLSDAYGLIRFLKFRPWNDWSQFNETIARNEKKRPKLATDRLQSIFKTTLLRRNKDTVLDGKRLITLPPKTVELVKLEFCPEEREIYKAVSMPLPRFLLKLTIFPDRIEVPADFQSIPQGRDGPEALPLRQAIHNSFSEPVADLLIVLVMLLRLRQICNHPALISEREDMEAVGRTRAEAEVARAMKTFGAGFITKVMAKIRDLETERMEVELTVREPHFLRALVS